MIKVNHWRLLGVTLSADVSFAYTFDTYKEKLLAFKKKLFTNFCPSISWFNKLIIEDINFLKSHWILWKSMPLDGFVTNWKNQVQDGEAEMWFCLMNQKRKYLNTISLLKELDSFEIYATLQRRHYSRHASQSLFDYLQLLRVGSSLPCTLPE